MIKQEFYYPSADEKTQIHAVEWKPKKEIIGVIQVAHGVTEHILRYEHFAEYFTQRGFVVVGNDHLGHGTSIAPNSKPMYFGPKNSWNFVVKDMETCRKMTKEKYPDVPYVLLGFSLGSFLVRTYLIDYKEPIDAAIIMGTGYIPNFKIAIAKMLANKEAKKVGEENTSPVIKGLTFETYNQLFKPNRTECDWLCANEEAIDEYLKDPLRGESYSAGLFRELLSGMQYTSNLKNIQKMNKKIPILLLSGDKDPVGDFGKGTIKTFDVFRKAGIENVDIRLYRDLRHDILHEECRRKIYNDIYRWLRKYIEL